MQSAEFEAVSPSSTASSTRGGTTTRRFVGAVTATASGSLLTVAALLTPSTSGLGTHQQLFASPCAWITGVDCPCPTCGMTTAFAHAADGNLLASFLTQPMGAILAVATAMAFLLGSYTAVTGSRIAHRLTRLWRPRMIWAIAFLVIGSWIYKIIWYKGWL